MIYLTRFNLNSGSRWLFIMDLIVVRVSSETGIAKALCLISFFLLLRAGPVGPFKYEWEGLLDRRAPEASGFDRRFPQLSTQAPPSHLCMTREAAQTPINYVELMRSTGWQEHGYGGRDTTEPGSSVLPLSVCVTWRNREVGTFLNLSSARE